MKVYIVMALSEDAEYSNQDFVEKIFSTKEKAESYIENEGNGHYTYTIEEMEVE